VPVIPSSPSAAVSPSATMQAGRTMSISERMNGRQAAISAATGLRLLVVCFGVEGRNLTMLEI